MLTWLLKKTKAYRTLDARLRDLERQFVTRRDEEGKITETLADVPVEQREELRKRAMKKRPWPQQRAWLEHTDGGRMH